MGRLQWIITFYMKNSSRHSTLLSAQSSLRVLGASKRQAFPSPAFLSSYGPFVLGPFCPQAFLSVYPVKYRQPSTGTVLWTVSYSLSSFPYHMSFFVFFFSQNHRSYTGNNNNIIHTVHTLSVTFDRSGLLTGVAKKQWASDRGEQLTGGI